MTDKILSHRTGAIGHIVFNNPEWTAAQFRPGLDLARADSVDNGRINALSADIAIFLGRGKLVQYHGWSDPQISPTNSVRYYDSVVTRWRDIMRIENSYRLFMAPGMGHCRGGDGPNSFDMVTALEEWVEQGKAPDRILATHRTNGQVDRTRPLCPYPSVARYTGIGSIDDAANFVCARD
jgi:feruloyl esterase